MTAIDLHRVQHRPNPVGRNMKLPACRLMRSCILTAVLLAIAGMAATQTKAQATRDTIWGTGGLVMV
jgi:hypothetical protein